MNAELISRLMLHADRCAECGHDNAARAMHEAARALANLRDLLKPFADCVLQDSDGVTVKSCTLEIGDFVRASRALVGN